MLVGALGILSFGLAQNPLLVLMYTLNINVNIQGAYTVFAIICFANFLAGFVIAIANARANDEEVVYDEDIENIEDNADSDNPNYN